MEIPLGTLGSLRSRSTAGRRKARVLPIKRYEKFKKLDDKSDTYPSLFLLVPRDPCLKVLTKKKVNIGINQETIHGTSSVAADGKKELIPVYNTKVFQKRSDLAHQT
jgi:hypothetical protein